MEKSLVLIDGENVFRSWGTYCFKNNIKEDIDYVKLINKVSEGTNLLRGIFYDGVPENIPVGKKKFLEALQHNNINLKLKYLKKEPINVMIVGQPQKKTFKKE